MSTAHPQSTLSAIGSNPGKLVAGAAIVVVLAAIGYFATRNEKKTPSAAQPPDLSLVELGKQPNSIRFKSAEGPEKLRITTTETKGAGSPTPLRLPGTLTPNPDRFIRVNARFSGEAVRMGTVMENGRERQLQFGDRVKKGQLLAVIWSKNIGEKKSELIDAYSRLELNRAVLKRLESVAQGVIAESKVFEARRDLEADLIAASKIERTLQSWRLTEEEIEAVRQEAKNIMQRKEPSDKNLEKSWAETEVRAAMDGTILEKNFNVGDIIEQTDDLFKIADLTRLRVIAHIYEEDLWAIRQLEPHERKWSLDLKSNPNDKPIEGTFELIGSVVDPGSRTGVLMGWVDNTENNLAVGQFITATIQLPANQNEVAIPEKALIEEGDRSMVFVQDRKEALTFTRRRVSISRRSAGMVYLHTKLSDQQKAAGLQSVEVGEKVAVSSALGLGGELEKLQSLIPSG